MTARVRVNVDTGRVRAAEREAAARGLSLAAEHLLGASRQLVPLEEGTLERSGVASVDASSLTGAVSYDTVYSVVQHERLDLRHAPGRQAKYLEQPAHTEAETMSVLIAAALREAL